MESTHHSKSPDPNSNMHDLDFEEAQALLELDTTQKSFKLINKSPNPLRESNPRHFHHRHKSRHYSHRHRSKPHHRHYSRSRSHSRSHNNSHSRSRKDSEKLKEKLQERTIEEARRQAIEAQRYDCTVFMYSLSQIVNEKKVFEFFSNANIGRIIDIKLLRDSKTGKSRNGCYVEFENQEASSLAIGLTGSILCGQIVQIVPSQAEKNRHAAAAKYKKEQIKEQQRIHLASATEQIDLSDAPMKIYVGGLTENLADITEADLQNIFAFGDIDSIELHRDPITSKSKGFAFIQFHRASQARQAIKAMNGFNYKGKCLKVGEANENNTSIQHDDNIEMRNELIQKMGRFQGGNLPQIETSCILLSNFFDLNDSRFKSDKYFYDDLYEDVMQQCSMFGSVDKMWIDQNSQGNIWIKYNAITDPKSAYKAVEGLQCKQYDNRQIYVKLISENLFNATVKE